MMKEKLATLALHAERGDKRPLGFSEACEWADLLHPIEHPDRHWEIVRDDIKPALRQYHPVIPELKKINASEEELDATVHDLAEAIIADPLECARYRILTGVMRMENVDYALTDFQRASRLELNQAIHAVDLMGKLADPKRDGMRDPHTAKRFKDEALLLAHPVNSWQKIGQVARGFLASLSN